jgi:bisphosphoglycerate-independent phosphoglycerate mutase (AlkP superfamily)
MPGGRRIDGLRIVDVAPTILQLFDLPIPEDMEGKAVAAADL